MSPEEKIAAEKDPKRRAKLKRLAKKLETTIINSIAADNVYRDAWKKFWGEEHPGFTCSDCKRKK